MGGFNFAGKRWKRLPFDIVWANDIDAAACAVYRHNLGHEIHCGPLSEVMNTMPRKADVVIGGFPCQDVSINGARQCENGGRTILYREMIEVIKRTRPKAFVAENVKGLKMAHGRQFFDQMLGEFEALSGYKVEHRVYLAADYHVPQMRERLFIVGVRGRRPFFHPQPHKRRMTAKDAIHDLASEPEDPGFSHVWSMARRSPEQGNRCLQADRPATTIRAEHHGNVQWHYSLPRRISLREAARLQSFPDEFVFAKGMRRTERQIGNAVPPVLAWHIAQAMQDCIDG